MSDEFIEPKRAYRIRQRLRMIARARNYALEDSVSYSWLGKDTHRYEKAEMHARYHHDHLAICSCDSCGNPRHNSWDTAPRYRLTLQEQRANIDEIEQVEELRYDQD